MKLSFARWLKLQRDIAGVTQAQIAAALDVRPQTVSNWEKGISIPSLNPEQTRQLCQVLQVDLEVLAKGFRGEVTVS